MFWEIEYIQQLIEIFMLNVLINAYAVSPTWGSEPGMGWNWITNLAKYCNLHIITEGEWQEEIESAMNSLENAERLHFHYINVSPEIRKNRLTSRRTFV